MVEAGDTTHYDGVTALIDLARYPIEDLSDAVSRTFLEQCRARLRKTGLCHLPGFVKPAAAAAMAKEGLAELPSSYRDESRHNVYFTAQATGLATDHPGVQSQRLATHTIPYDLIGAEAMLRRLYHWPPLLAFVAAVLERPVLYLHGDPMGALIVFVHGEGDQLGWHFDHADFVTTLILQAPERGGVFEYLPNLRKPDEENIEGIKRVLEGADKRVVRVPSEAGSLSVFAGQHSIHRVTPTEGSRARVVAVLSNEKEPEVQFTDEERIRFYGRAGLQT